jgi:predicted transposase YdaD
MKESTTYQSILAEGRAEGEAEGKVKGALAEARKIVIRLGTPRFGPPAAAVRAALEGITDVERLEDLCARTLEPQAASWEDLLGLPAPRSRSRRRPKV